MSENKISVAVVDDDASFSKAICRLLRAAGFEPAHFASAEAFLVPVTSPPPACLVLDIQLGGMSGLELLQHLRARGTLTPVIFVTAHDELETRNEARQAGCVAYLRKPVASRALLEAITQAVGSVHGTASL